jgi:hypothetical protein
MKVKSEVERAIAEAESVEDETVLTSKMVAQAVKTRKSSGGGGEGEGERDGDVDDDDDDVSLSRSLKKDSVFIEKATALVSVIDVIIGLLLRKVKRLDQCLSEFMSECAVTRGECINRILLELHTGM